MTKVLRWLVVAVFIAVIVWPIWDGRAISLFGLGAALLILWAAVLGWMVLRYHAGNLYRRWNRWLGALIISAALIGMLVLFNVSGISYLGVSLDPTDQTMGGTLGQYVLGKLGPAVFNDMYRLIVIAVLGLIIVIPTKTWQLISGAIGLLKREDSESSAPTVMPSDAPVGNLEPVAESDADSIDADPVDQAIEEEDHIDYPLGEHPGDLSYEVQEIRENVMEEKEAALTGPIDLLIRAPIATDTDSVKDVNEQRAQIIEKALESYGVDAKVVQINPGPTITQFGLEPGWDRKYKKIIERDYEGKVKRDRNGSPIEYFEEISRTRVKVDRITSLTNDLALALAAPSIRFEAPVPGKSIIGLEVPNEIKSVVSLRDCMESEVYAKDKAKSKLALALGQGAGGEVVVGDLAQMPHLLIAGATGSGKTVCLSAVIACILVNNTPSDVRMLLIDPKRVELVAYNDIPHLISSVVVDLEEAIGALRKVTWEMDNRYKKFAAAGVNNIVNFNKKVKQSDRLPYLVVIIDELADLMSASADMVEPAICRIAQLSRATGIHVIIATQRPSVDVITGLIKANFPTRISFSVPSQIDSRTILDVAGAEKLLGSGDMLYFPIGAAKPRRLRGAYVSDKEVARLVKFWRERRDTSGDTMAEAFAALEPPPGTEEDTMLEEARRLAIESNRISTSFLQRRLRIGYPRAARIMDMLEEEGIISAAEPGKPREVLGSDNGDYLDDV
ncbi:DNA translocase FtsK [Chloroflexota bacterium]